MSTPTNLRRFNIKFDELEAAIFSEKEKGISLTESKSKIDHIFTPGIYMRKMFLPKGEIITGKIHKTIHPFIMSLGVIRLWSFEYPDGVQVVAPYHGITQIGTRRLIFAEEDTYWTEIHPNPDNCKDLTILEERLIQPHTNKLLMLQLNEAS